MNVEWKKKTSCVREECFKGKSKLLHSLVLGMTRGAYFSKGCCMNTLTILVLGILNSLELEGYFLVSTLVLYWDCHLPLLFLHLWAHIGWGGTAKQVASAEEFLEQNKKKSCLCGSSDRYFKETSDRSSEWANIVVLKAAEQIGLKGTNNPSLQYWNMRSKFFPPTRGFTFQNFPPAPIYPNFSVYQRRYYHNC